MENGLNMNTLGTFLMEPRDQKDHAKSSNDIMTRRLKNRERQRRYRERKRLEADRKKASTLSSSKQLHLEMLVNGLPSNFVTSVHCRRNWKKDARRAHAVKEQEVKSYNPFITGLTSANEIQLPMLPSGSEVNQPMESEFRSSNFSVLDSSERRFTPGGRHWKADARSKKN